ncbi:MAG: TolC family protein [Muribaculaceae bacterium]|nr:TolC family protein [Muribaculaceae bacterium]
MKRFYFSIIIISLLAFLFPNFISAQTHILSRQQCLEIALQDNPTVKIADWEVKKVNYAKKETLASVFPSIDFSTAYQRSIELQTIRMDFGGESQSLKMGSDNTWNIGFSASLPLIAPTLWKAIDISDTQILASLEDARASRLDLVNQVNKAYYALMLAVASKAVIQQNYDVALFNADIYQKQFENGTASEYDVLRSSVQVKNIEPELLQADIALKQCQLQLKVLMGISSEYDIMPDISLNDLTDEMWAYPIDNSISLQDNSSLRSLEIQKTLLSKNVTLKKFAWIPTLGASYNLSWTSLSNGSPFRNQQFNPYSYVGVALSVPIFSGGSKFYGLKQAQVQLKEIDLQKDYLINSLNMQVDLAIDNINREAAQISSSKESVLQAKKAYEIMQKSFEIGAASYLELRDAELANTSAQLVYLQAIYNYLVSSSELDLLLGKENLN